jgi:hypothetical protein
MAGLVMVIHVFLALAEKRRRGRLKGFPDHSEGLPKTRSAPALAALANEVG